MTTTEAGILFDMRKCIRAYRHIDVLASHGGECADKPSSRQVLNRAAYIAMEIVHTSEAGYYVSAYNHLTLIDVSVSSGVVTKYSVPCQWAKHPPRGELLGTN